MESNKLVFDVGMHKGEDSDFYLKKGFNVVAFEADPDLANLCRARFSEQIKTKQLTIVEGAIIDIKEYKGTEKTITFYKNNKSSVWGTVDHEWANRNDTLGADSQEIKVDIIDFADCMRQYGVPHYMKIDIEGMDVICLKALIDFKERPSYISIESEKVSFDKLKEEFDIFNRLGYDSFQLINQTRITSQREPQNTKEGKYANYKFLKGATGLFGKDLSHSNWLSTEQSLQQYKKIFKNYKSLGDSSTMNKYLLGKFVIKSLNKLFGIPGWFDTHAKHSSVKS